MNVFGHEHVGPKVETECDSGSVNGVFQPVAGLIAVEQRISSIAGEREGVSGSVLVDVSAVLSLGLGGVAQEMGLQAEVGRKDWGGARARVSWGIEDSAPATRRSVRV